MAPGATQAIEVDAGFGSQHQLAVEGAGCAWHLANGLGDNRVALSQIAAVAAEQSGVAASLHALHAPAVESWLMQPTVTRRRLLGRARLAGLDKGQGRRHKTLSRKKQSASDGHILPRSRETVKLRTTWWINLEC